MPTPIGRGPAFVPPAVGPGPAPARRCTERPRAGSLRVHLELFARGRVVVIPKGIGFRRRCRYPIRTLEPTGVLELDRPGLELRDVFAVWRMPFSANRMLGFRGAVRAYVGGTRWAGDVTRIPLRHEDEIVLEVGAYVRPHSFYLFPPR